MTEVNKERVALLVAALRSGDYPKATHRLHMLDPEGWCCLGVASDVAARNGLELARTREGDCEVFDENEAYLPESVTDWYGFDNYDPVLVTPGGLRRAARVNDSGYYDADGNTVEASLADIAGFFEATFLAEE